MDARDGPCTGPKCGTGSPRLSYKFQRLREEIRTAIQRGDFIGRLPGERELGRKYGVNAKTVNKALCDLSSEGLLVRHIGKGTFVAQNDCDGRNGEPGKTFRWLLPAATHKNANREALLASVSSALAARRHNVERVVAVGNNGSPEIPLHCWPAATRSSTDGLIVYPRDPLSGHWGRLNEACLAEAWRRHVAVVVLGGVASVAKLDAAVPDFVDAGFRLTEYLIRLGCQEIRLLVTEEKTREARLVVSGCHAAGLRFNRPVHSVVLSERKEGGMTAKATAFLEMLGQAGTAPRRGIQAGLICVGRAATQVASASEAIGELRVRGNLAVACVLEAGDPMAGALGLTSYEVDPEKIAEWGVRLLLDSRPGHMPVEIIVPGEVVIRGPIGKKSPKRQAEDSITQPAGRVSAGREVTSDANV